MQLLAFFNHKPSQCGVYDYGKRVADILVKSKKLQVDYYEVSTIEEFVYSQNSKQYAFIILNYHYVTMPWLTANLLKAINKYTVSITHESPDAHLPFNLRLNVDPNAVHGIPRPLVENHNPKSTNSFITSYVDSNIPIIGSFGFGFRYKGFDRIVDMVNKEFDEAVIKFIIPIPTYATTNEIQAVRDQCLKINLKPGVKLEMSHEFYDSEEIVQFLASNTINCFFYPSLDGRSISSVIDYAISAKTPLCITNSTMFRHIFDSSICVDSVGIRESMKSTHIKQFNERWSNTRLIETIESYLGL